MLRKPKFYIVAGLVLLGTVAFFSAKVNGGFGFNFNAQIGNRVIAGGFGLGSQSIQPGLEITPSPNDKL